MKRTVGVDCSGCGVQLIVMQPEVYEAVGQLWGIEGELEFKEMIAADETKTGARLAVIDADRVYTCPACGIQGRLPPANELFLE